MIQMQDLIKAVDKHTSFILEAERFLWKHPETGFKEVKTSAGGLKIKASMKVGDAEKLFDTNFGVTVQIKDVDGKKLVPNGITIGQAARGEY